MMKGRSARPARQLRPDFAGRGKIGSLNAAPSTSRLQDLLRLVGINTGLLVAGIIAIEFALGHWFVDFVVPDPRLVGRAFTFRQTLYEPHGDIAYERDQYGFRPKQPVASVELVTVGGSTTAQSFIRDGETWQDEIHRRTGIVVANAGIDRMGTQKISEIVEDWLHKIPGLRAKYCLHYIGFNDTSMTQTATVARERRYSWTRRIRGRSAILQGVSRIRDWLRGPHIPYHSAVHPGLQPLQEMRRADADRGEIRAYVEKFYKFNVRSLLQVHRDRGETAIFVTQTANPALVGYKSNDVFVARLDLARWAVTLDEINRATQAVCREHHGDCRLVDLAADLSFDPADFYDLVRNTPKGARRIGEFLASRLDFVRSGPPREAIRSARGAR